MTATEDRLKAVLAETANTVREDTLRPLTLRRRTPRRWPRTLAPIAAAAAVVLILGGEIVAEQLTGTPRAPGRAAGLPTVQIGRTVTGMAYDGANATIYLSVSHSRRVSASRGGVEWGPGTLAMVSVATCNASSTRGCAHVSRVPAGGRGGTDVAVNPRAHTVYVLNGWSKTVTVINADTCNAATASGCSPAARVRLPGAATGLAVNPRTGAVYVADLLPTGLSVINGNTCDASDTSGCARAPATVSLGNAPRSLPTVTVDPGTNTVYLSVHYTMRVLDGRTCNGTDTQGCTKVLGTVPFPSYPFGITIDAAAGTIYAAGSTGLMAIDQKTCNALDTTGCARPPATIRAGPGPGASAADPGTKTIYVANEPGSVSMVNSATCNARAVSACPEFPAAFTVTSAPSAIAVDPAAHTVYVMNLQAGNMSVINATTCNATDQRGCPTRPAARTPKVTPYTCDSALSAYNSGVPAASLVKGSVRVASGSAGGQAWSVWAKKGVIDPYGIEQGGLVLNGRWYPLCDSGLNAGPDANFQLIDAGAHGIVYGYIQHPNKVTIRLGNHHPQWTPQQVLLRGTTFFILRLPRSACAYRGLTVNAWQGKKWGGYSNKSFGTCLQGQIVRLTVGRGSWGPQYPGQHW